MQAPETSEFLIQYVPANSKFKMINIILNVQFETGFLLLNWLLV